MVTDQGELPWAAGQGRLEARPHDGSKDAVVTRGEQALKLAAGRDGVLYVPARYQPGRPAPLVLCLHGAGGSGANNLAILRVLAEQAGLLLVAPDSRRQTWDMLAGGYGPDVAFIDEALALMFDRFSVDAAHVAIEGFSDGASYALSLGIANGRVAA